VDLHTFPRTHSPALITRGRARAAVPVRAHSR
jgi:hypothetical protein